jgi:phage protein D
MSSKTLYANVPGIDGIISVNVSQSHASATATANVEALELNKEIGDEIEIDLGYTDNHRRVFLGYVKDIQQKTPDGVYQVSAYDKMIRAVDFFVASSDPEKPFKRRDISAEGLIKDVLELSGLTNFQCPVPSEFTLAIGADAEVNLVSAYDYCKSIADIVAWSLFADENGVIWFKNRKPYVMTGTSQQVGDVPDVAYATLTDEQFLEISFGVNERDLRNRVVVYGSEGVHAEASNSQSYDPSDGQMKQILPDGYYKSVVFASPLLTETGVCTKSATYNLAMLNRLGNELQLTIEGWPGLTIRKTLMLNSAVNSIINGHWYVYQLDHSWSRSGYTCNTVLRR